jgi:isopentenyl phosphate kinase
MGSPPPVVVKLGGSVLTRKRGAARLRPKILARLASELAGPGAPPLVVLHGAGSYGHPGAAKWRLASTPDAATPDEAGRRRGAAIVSAEVRRLHGAVLRGLLDAGLAPWSVPASALALNRAGRLVRFDAEPFVRALARGLVPVSFGDVVPDEEWAFSILSADTIAVELARALPAGRVLFVSDVDGLLERAPGAGRPVVVPRLTRDLVAALVPTSGAPDVTGGIRGKAVALLEIGEAGVPAGIISGLRHGSLSRAIRGESVYGSWTGPVAP